MKPLKILNHDFLNPLFGNKKKEIFWGKRNLHGGFGLFFKSITFKWTNQGFLFLQPV